MNTQNLLKLLLLQFILIFLITDIVQSQTSYEAFKRGQTMWRSDYGVSVGPNTGLNIMFFNARRNTCKVLSKKHAIDLGIYYEGLLFKENLSSNLTGWDAGGIRGELAYLYFLNLNAKSNRFYFGGGAETGTRQVYDNSNFYSDLIAKAGWEHCFLPSTGMPLVIRTSIKYNKCLNNNFTYVLPSIAFVFGK